MFRKSVGILVLMIAALLFAQEDAKAQIIVKPAQSFYVRLAGNIYDRQTGTPLASVTIRNLRSRKVSVSDSNGFFSIVLTQEDTLELRRVGYKSVYYQKEAGHNGNYYQRFFLNEEAVEIKEVTIYRKRPALRSVALNPEYNRPDPFRLQIGVAKGSAQAPTITSPISYLYDQFSSRGKAARKLATLKAERELIAMAGIRYNQDYVESLTGLHGEELVRFMAFCPMAPEFILSTSDYELAAAALACYRRYLDY
jgi:hypothetical protein